MIKFSIKKGDIVEAISGKWKGEQGKVIAVLSKKQRVVLEMTGLSPEKLQEVGRRTVKKTPENPKGGLIERAVSVHISSVKLKVKGEKENKKDETRKAS
ncbi:MAG: KOW motif-containing protein [Victivallales bacterium]